MAAVKVLKPNQFAINRGDFKIASFTKGSLVFSKKTNATATMVISIAVDVQIDQIHSPKPGDEIITIGNCGVFDFGTNLVIDPKNDIKFNISPIGDFITLRAEADTKGLKGNHGKP
jgi:hypothetical protein